MKQNLKLATQVVLVSGTVCLTASCTTSKVYSVVPQDKPSAEEIAMLTTLQQTDTTALATQTAAIDFKPVDLATDRSVAMAYAIPAPKPANDAAAAIQAQSVEVASADPAAAQELMANPGAVKTRSLGSVTLEDDFGKPELTATTALLEQTRVEKAQEPFVSSTQNTNLNQLITKYAALYDVPESLVHHVVRRETNYNPAAVHRGNWGLMQIRYNTAKGLGYDGAPTGLLDAETNLKYAVKYLKGAWIVADKDAKKADWLYRTGYYYEAKKKQLLDELELK
jgi:soluble lytic murein transglycosylase-like protein